MVGNISIYWYLFSSSTAVFLLTSLIHLWENPDGSVITRIFHNQESEIENYKILNGASLCFRSHHPDPEPNVNVHVWEQVAS